MDMDTYEGIIRILALLGFAIRFLGLLVLGLGTGWFAVSAYKKPGLVWKTQVAVVFVFAAVTIIDVGFAQG
jgi:hypothetical protein